MNTTLTLSELHTRISPDAHEAVAVVLALINGEVEVDSAAKEDTCAPALPSLSTLILADDGTVKCAHAIPALSPVAVAALLQQLLEDAPRVPPGLLFATARALHAVEAPPFETLDELFRALSRFERGPRRGVIAQLVSRFEASCDSTAWGVRRRERRGTKPQVTLLRLELRAADRRAYEQSITAAPARRPRARVWTAVAAASFAAGLACMAMGDAIAMSVPPARTVPLVVSDAPLPAETPHQPLAAVVRRGPVTSRPVIRRAATTRHPPSRWRSVLGFQWMRHLITSRKDL